MIECQKLIFVTHVSSFFCTVKGRVSHIGKFLDPVNSVVEVITYQCMKISNKAVCIKLHYQMGQWFGIL